MRARRVSEPPLSVDDVARSQWENYVESRVNHLHEPRVTPTRRRVRRGEAPMQRHEDALLLYLRTYGH